MGIFYGETMKGLYSVFPDKGLIARTARPEDVSYAAEISAIIKSPENQNKMIPLEPDQLIALWEDKRGVIVVDSNSGRIVSHAAVTYELIDRSVEVGAVCTHPDQRGRGGAWIATSGAIYVAHTLYPGKYAIAMIGVESKSIFTKLGAVEIDCSQVHKELWGRCEHCPRAKRKNGPITKCIHTPVNVSDVATLFDNSDR